MKTKRCSHCKKIKDASEFGKKSSNKDGLNSWCKECSAKKDKEYAEKNKENLLKNYEKLPKCKKCTECGEVKNILMFYKRSGSKDGFDFLCKECHNKKSKEYKNAHKEEVKEYNKKYNEDHKEEIKEKSLGYYEEHGEEIRQYSRKYREEHREESKAYNKKYNEDHKEEIKENKKEYRKEHKEEIKEYNKRYKKEHKDELRELTKNRKKIDINFKIARNLRIRLNKAVKNNQKSGSAVRDLGCSIDELKERFISMFCPNQKTGEEMTWENYGKKWHIDHIVPLSKFNLSDRGHLLYACHYTNLQPLWAEDNLSKGAK